MGARTKFWLLKNGFRTDVPLAMHVSRDGKRSLITRFIQGLEPREEDSRAARQETVENQARSKQEAVQKLEEMGAKPHDYHGVGGRSNTLFVPGEREPIFIDTELFDVPDAKAKKLLQKLWRHAFTSSRRARRG